VGVCSSAAGTGLGERSEGRALESEQWGELESSRARAVGGSGGGRRGTRLELPRHTQTAGTTCTGKCGADYDAYAVMQHMHTSRQRDNSSCTSATHSKLPNLRYHVRYTYSKSAKGHNRGPNT